MEFVGCNCCGVKGGKEWEEGKGVDERRSEIAMSSCYRLASVGA